MLRYAKTGVLGILGLALTVLAVILVRGAIEAPSPTDPAPLIAKADSYDATIERDEWGVPHVFGKRDADVSFGIGYAHSEDDFATIQDVLIATRGKLASVKGERAAVSDYLVNLMGIWETIDARYESDLSPEVREVIEAYADEWLKIPAMHYRWTKNRDWAISEFGRLSRPDFRCGSTSFSRRRRSLRKRRPRLLPLGENSMPSTVRWTKPGR